MILIVGGAFQGKTEFAKTLTGIPVQQFTDGRQCLEAELYTGKVICYFEELIGRMLKKDKDPMELLELLEQRNPKVVLVSRELGYGVVPVDAFDRKYRETVGRVCTRAAAASQAVYRVVCGIGMKIK